MGRPSIASTNRRRLGSFASLLDQILQDGRALDGLAFAYAELGEPERRALAHAVVRDARSPNQALAALLAVEENPRLRQRLAELIQRRGGIKRSAFVEGTDAQGGACLVQTLPGIGVEALWITWKEHAIDSIEVKSRKNPTIIASGPRVTLDEAVETLAPLLWRHVRLGGQLPEGAMRFAGFF